MGAVVDEGHRPVTIGRKFQEEEDRAVKTELAVENRGRKPDEEKRKEEVRRKQSEEVSQ